MEISVADVIEKLKKTQNLKTDKEVAEYLNIATNTINNIKTRNSLGTFIEKIITNYVEEDFISLDYLFNPNVSLEVSRLFLKAIKIAHETESMDTFEDLIENFTIKGSVLSIIFKNLQTQKGKSFFVSFFNSDPSLIFDNLLFLQKTLETIDKTSINLSHPKQDFLEIVTNLETSNDLFGIHLQNFNRDNLITLMEETLDDISCYEIITCLPTILQKIDAEINNASTRNVDKILKPIRLK